MPTCWIIAGPNGAGKTTFGLKFLPKLAKTKRFLNVDSIAAGLNPLEPEKHLREASLLFLREMNAAGQSDNDFAFETTLSGMGHLRRIRKLREAGWRVELLFLALSRVEVSKARVAERVARGGHDVPNSDLERRFPRSLRNLFAPYGAAVNQVHCFLNDRNQRKLVFKQTGEERIVFEPETYEHLLLESRKT